MSVYTELSHHDVETILNAYPLPALQCFKGIAAGIENSNFFVDTADGSRFVLTIFERMQADELPYFMELMAHLSSHGVICPAVQRQHDGALLFHFAGKQGCIVTCMPGSVHESLNIAQLHSAGAGMAHLHLAGQNFPQQRENPTGMAWLADTSASIHDAVSITYGRDAAQLLHDEIQWQQQQDVSQLPSGVIHGDYFCDNILFEGDTLSGIIDFYYAHHAVFAMDIAIALNALAVQLGTQDEQRMQAFLDGYASVRPLEQDEQDALPTLLRLGALRFWTSRLFDAVNPREGAMTQIKDPNEYQQKLLLHRNR